MALKDKEIVRSVHVIVCRSKPRGSYLTQVDAAQGLIAMKPKLQIECTSANVAYDGHVVGPYKLAE